jgi:hypothetical protein
MQTPKIKIINEHASLQKKLVNWVFANGGITVNAL